jgi:iron complex transport system substrate-binding protein
MRSSTVSAVAVAAASAVMLAACGSSSDDTDGADGTETSAEAFPVTIEHAFGETTIESEPERVATVAWANHEVPLALGVVPVGMAAASWGDDDGDGVLPWVEDRLEELDAETPVLFDETDGIDFEAVADTQPDVVLASYSGLTKEEYETLSKIAPVVAYPELAWGTSLQDMIRLNSAALGLAEQGDELVGDLDKQVADAVADHPQLEGKSAAFTYLDPNDLSSVWFYTTHDPRAGFLEQIGMTTPEVIAAESAKSDEFGLSVSAEEADKFEDVDFLITYGDAEGALLEQVQEDRLLAQIPAVEEGAVAMLEDSTPLAASANPSPLSIGWGIDQYLEVLAAAADKAA